MRSPETDVDFARHIIEYDPDNPATYAAWSTVPSQTDQLARRHMQAIPWPTNLAPSPSSLTPQPDPTQPLPKADVLVVTWTVAEGRALADVLTPGHASDGWYHYRHLYDQYVSLIRKEAPALEAKRLGSLFPTSIGGRKVLCFKSELHMSQDGPKLPVRVLWKQIIAETGARLVISTGTAGAIGASVKLGDVVLAGQVRFDCQKTFKNESFNQQTFTSRLSIPTTYLSVAASKLIPANAGQLPANHEPLELLFRKSAQVPDDTVVTTDFFAFDTANDEYQLQGLGAAVEMGDAVLGLVCSQDLDGQGPSWLAIRNASDPQISADLSPNEQRKQAAQIYEKYGYWTTVGSAIATWAGIAGS
jgi:hypothetical protein